MELKRQELTARRDEIVKDIANHNEADDSFAKRLISIVELASKAGETFKGSTINEKRELINLVLLNLKLNGCKLVYTLRPPFDAFVKCTKKEDWYGWRDLNPHALRR